MFCSIASQHQVLRSSWSLAMAQARRRARLKELRVAEEHIEASVWPSNASKVSGESAPLRGDAIQHFSWCPFGWWVFGKAGSCKLACANNSSSNCWWGRSWFSHAAYRDDGSKGQSESLRRVPKEVLLFNICWKYPCSDWLGSEKIPDHLLYWKL